MQTVREVAVEIIDKALGQEVYSNLELSRVIKEGLVEPRDVGLLTELVYGTIQNKQLLDYFLAPFISGKRVNHYVRNNLRMAVYQLEFLDRVPEHAIVHEAVEMAKGHDVKAGRFVNAVLREILRQGVPSMDKIEDPIERLSIETSHPQWLITMWSKQYSLDLAKRLSHYNQTKPNQFARLNLHKDSRERIFERLTQEQVAFEPIAGHPEAVRILSENVANTKLFREGYLTVQDLSSLMVGKVLSPKPGERVLDACSAPGGKATHLAEMMGDEGEVIACDLHSHKMDLIRYNKHRLGLKAVKEVLSDARMLSETFEAMSFDAVLVDAPCSGFGVIRRKPEIKYNRTPEDIDAMVMLQQEIIDEALTMVKPGGRLVFSTCTVNRKENERMVEYILQNDAFTLDSEAFKTLGIECDGYVQHFEPSEGSDVFFISAFKRVN